MSWLARLRCGHNCLVTERQLSNQAALLPSKRGQPFHVVSHHCLLWRGNREEGERTPTLAPLLAPRLAPRRIPSPRQPWPPPCSPLRGPAVALIPEPSPTPPRAPAELRIGPPPRALTTSPTQPSRGNWENGGIAVFMRPHTILRPHISARAPARTVRVLARRSRLRARPEGGCPPPLQPPAATPAARPPTITSRPHTRPHEEVRCGWNM